MLRLSAALVLLTVFADGRLDAAPKRSGHSPDILATQVMLDRAGFSPGEIDGRSGPNLQRALAAFKKAGRSTEASAPATMTYTLTDADIAGPFASEIPEDMAAKSKLPALGYANTLEAIAERFHASPALLRELNPQATFTRAGEQVVVPNVTPMELPVTPPPAADPAPGKARGGGAPASSGSQSAAAATAPAPAAQGASSQGTQSQGAAPQGAAAQAAAETGPLTIVVSKSTSALTVENTKGEVLLHAPVTTGSRHDPLPLGKWKVNGVQRNPTFNYNPALFWDAEPGDTKARIAAGPNNPVGTIWIDISKEHYGIHGTPEPGSVGHVESHGCVRMTNWDVQRVAALVKPGTAVLFRR